ncbi:MAG: prolyl oligopeptidase family serine peptidase [Planctomycetota bacterium]
MRTPIFTLGIVLFVSSFALAQEGYRLPPAEVVAIADAPQPPSVSFSPDRKWMTFTQSDPMPSIQEVSRRMLRIGGLRIDPVSNTSFRTQYPKSFAIRKTDGKDIINIPIPANGKFASASWSHNSKFLAFTVVTDRGTELWVSSVEKPAEPRKITDRICATMTRGISWTPDGQNIICTLVPQGRGAEPPAPATPTGPNIQETSGSKSPVRTYQDLLSNPHDEALFEYYTTSQLAIASVENGSLTLVGKPAIYSDMSHAPGAPLLLVNKIHRPFSYIMPANDFPTTIEVMDYSGKQQFLVAEVPLAENIPIEGVRTGPRSINWKRAEPATLVWLEALDGGDPKKKAEFRDRYVSLASPFTGTPAEMFKLEHRAGGIQYMKDTRFVIATDVDRDKRWTRTRIFDTKNPTAAPKVIDDRSSRDQYKNPGALVMDLDSAGRGYVVEKDGFVFRTGTGATPDGDRPFFRRQNLETLAIEELWRCEDNCYESAIDLLDPESSELAILTSYETATTPPNYRIRKLGANSSITAITEFKDPTPQIRSIKKEIVKYKRADGTGLSATLYLPADYKTGTRLPLLVWAYPLEFNDAATAAQVSGSANRFTRLGGASHLYYLTQGYAIMDNATMPVIGDPETMNDTFIDQIVSSAQAAIDKAVEMGVADPSRVGVGGHSYGAFMTANLLAHCDLFRAGVARSGAYNRTLTPFGFQSERRTLWEAPNVYSSLSPFMYANKINEPLLMIHGEADSNMGTFPIQSERLFAAMKGNGKTARLVMLPNESHGYSARESNLHTLYEMIAWFDKYVKNAKPIAEAKDAGAKK